MYMYVLSRYDSRITFQKAPFRGKIDHVEICIKIFKLSQLVPFCCIHTICSVALKLVVSTKTV